MRVRRGIAAAAAVVLSGALAACGTDGGTTGPTDASSDAAGLTSTDPVGTDPLIWEADGVVHLADGTEVDLGGAPSSYVVAGDGVFFAPAEDAQQAQVGSSASAGIRFAAPGDEPVDTGLELQADTLRASPDGRFVAGIDVVSGEEDQYGTHLAQVVVIDLQEGREVLRSSEGMGDVADDDLTDLYEDSPLGIVRMIDETAFVDSASGLLAVDLATGDVEEAADVELPFPGDPQSPDGAWTFENNDDVRAEVVGRDGARVPLDVDAPQWTLKYWAGDTLAVGIAIHDDGSSSLMTCVVPDGSCSTLAATTGQTVRLVNGATDPSVVSLLGAGG